MSFLPDDIATQIDQNELIQRIRPPVAVSPLDMGVVDPAHVQPPDYSFWERFGLGNQGETGPAPPFIVGGSGGSGGGARSGLAAVAALLHGFLQGQAQRGYLSAQKKNQLVLGQLHDVALRQAQSDEAAKEARENQFKLQQIAATKAETPPPADTEMNQLVGRLLIPDAAKALNMNQRLDQMDRARRGYRAKGDSDSLVQAKRIDSDYDTLKQQRDDFIAQAGARAEAAGIQKATKTGEFAPGAAETSPANYVPEDDGRGGKFLDLSGYTGKAKEAARQAAISAGWRPLEKDPADALRQANQLDKSYTWMSGNLDMLPEKALPLGPLGPLSVQGATNLLTQNTDPRVNTFKMFRDPALQSMRVFGGSGGKGVRFTKEIIKLANETNVPDMVQPRDVAVNKITNGRQLIKIARDTVLGPQQGSTFIDSQGNPTTITDPKLIAEARRRGIKELQ